MAATTLSNGTAASIFEEFGAPDYSQITAHPVFHPIPGVEIGNTYTIIPGQILPSNEFRLSIAITAIGRDHVLAEITNSVNPNFMFTEIVLNKQVFMRDYLNG
jgi:hypothetical protein